MSDLKQLHISVGGKTLTFETGKIARQANCAVTLQCGETILLTTVCSAKKAAEEIDFLPLRVDYQEKFSSAGKTLGGFIKREGRPTEREILIGRLIDRPIRPFFEEGYFNEVQVLSYVYSYDGVNAPDPLAICAASAALVLSDIPFIKPIAGVRVGLIQGKSIINPTMEEQKNSKLDLLMAGSEDAILMIEGYADFLSEEQILEAINEGHQAIKIICQHLHDWQKIAGKEKDRSALRATPHDLIKEISAKYGATLDKDLRIKEKLAREIAMDSIAESIQKDYFPEGAEPVHSKTTVAYAFKQAQANVMRSMILKENRRIDGRTCTEIRPISVEQSLLPRTHGSSLFTRGETQALAVVTLAERPWECVTKTSITEMDYEDFTYSTPSLLFPLGKSAAWAPQDAEKSVTGNLQKELY